MLIFFPKKLFLYFAKQNFLIVFQIFFFVFPGVELSSHKNKKSQEVTFRARKVKKSCSEKNFFMFWEMKLSSPKYCFYALNKIPLRETGCLSSLYYLLATQESIFLIHSFFGTHAVSKPLVPCHSLCSNCVTYGMLCHAIGHQVCLTKTFLEK